MSRYILDNHKHLKHDGRKYCETLSFSRACINLTEKELCRKNMSFSPQISQGQSHYHILANHSKLGILIRTMYSYLDMGLFSVRKDRVIILSYRGILYQNENY